MKLNILCNCVNEAWNYNWMFYMHTLYDPIRFIVPTMWRVARYDFEWISVLEVYLLLRNKLISQVNSLRRCRGLWSPIFERLKHLGNTSRLANTPIQESVGVLLMAPCQRSDPLHFVSGSRCRFFQFSDAFILASKVPSIRTHSFNAQHMSSN